MKIQLAGYYYSRNLGDAVLCDCVKWLLKRRFPGVEICPLDIVGRTGFDPMEIIPFDPAFQKKWRREFHLARFLSLYTPIDYEYRHELHVYDLFRTHIQKALAEDADCCIFAGGQIMTDWLTLEVTEAAMSFIRRDKNVYFLSAGTGPVSSRHLQHIYRDLFRDPHVKLITLRDHADFFNQYYGIPEEKRAIETADGALWADEVYGPEISGQGINDQNITRKSLRNNESIPNNDSPLIGVGFYYPSMLSAGLVRKKMQALILCLEKHRIRWKAFTNGEGADAGFGEYVLKSIPGMYEQHGSELEAFPERPADLVRQIRNFDGIISFRLHSHIIAASLGIPSVAFAWDDKIRSFFTGMGCPERALAIDTDPEAVLSALSLAMTENWNRSLILEKRQQTMNVLTDALERFEGIRAS